MLTHAFTFVFLLAAPGHAAGPHPSATGALTVTAVVTSSVSVSFAPDGTERVVVANAPADASTIIQASRPLQTVAVSPENKPLKRFKQKRKRNKHGRNR